MNSFLIWLLSFLPRAFDATNMNRVHAGTKGLWVYESTQVIASIIASGYFSDYVNELKKGDVIIAIGSSGGTPTVDMLVVTSANNATPVTVANGT